MNPQYIDLHIHSNFSDGKESVESIVKSAIENNVRTISLTEHYNLSSLEIARNIAKNSLEIIPGIEIGSSLFEYGLSKKHVCHFTAYFVNRKIYKILDEYEITRKKNVTKIISKLNRMGINITSGQVVREVKKESIGRYDIAYTLFKKGYAVSPVHAYSKYLDVGKNAYVEREKMEPTKLIDTIIKCGGVPVLAHPKSLKFNNNDLEAFINIFKKAGLCGIKIGLGINENLKISDYSIITRLKEKKHENEEKYGA